MGHLEAGYERWSLFGEATWSKLTFSGERFKQTNPFLGLNSGKEEFLQLAVRNGSGTRGHRLLQGKPEQNNYSSNRLGHRAREKGLLPK
jgi:hypothetical protein